MIRIALNELGGKEWTGGITYRNNLLKALKSCPEKARLFQISRNNKIENSGQEIISIKNNANWFEKKYDAFSRHFLKSDYLMAKSLSKHSIDVLFPGTMSVGKKTAAIYWIPDFQFMHLPHMYTEKQLKQFDAKLNRYFNDVPLVVVSSKDAQKDFEKFSPQFLHKTRVLNFVAHVPDKMYDIDPKSIADIYHLPEDFIYMPNQFWAHKNHEMVFDALKLLKDQGIKPFVVCTGNPLDIRKPMHLAKLLQKIAELGIHDQIMFLGLIPHEHLYSLIRQSKCVLNPSHFEGWSTTVEESKSVGKRMILSDLGVHKEQNPAMSVYFDRYSAEDLSEKLKEIWTTVDSGPDLALESKAREALPARMEAFAQTFISICKEARDSKK